MKKITLDVPDEMFEALSELSGITEQSTEGDRIAKLLESSIRIYEWMLYQQLSGRKLAVLKPSDLEFLKGKLLDEKRDLVSPLFSEEKKPMLADYFGKAA